jgi:carbonic anhydrase
MPVADIESVFQGNRDWAGRIKQAHPDFFLELSRQQRPKYLWIGCADSRVPANQIIDLPPGEVFVHRNIANVVVHSDLNCLSVVQFAVEVLGVEHILVVGHYGCGGVRASLSDEDHGLIDNWLRHIRDVHRLHAGILAGVREEDRRVDLLCELNVIEQTRNLCTTTIVRNAWRSGQNLWVHGLVYSLKDGLLQRLCSHGADSPLDCCLDHLPSLGSQASSPG